MDFFFNCFKTFSSILKDAVILPIVIYITCNIKVKSEFLAHTPQITCFMATDSVLRYYAQEMSDRVVFLTDTNELWINTVFVGFYNP